MVPIFFLLLQTFSTYETQDQIRNSYVITFIINTKKNETFVWVSKSWNIFQTQKPVFSHLKQIQNS